MSSSRRERAIHHTTRRVALSAAALLASLAGDPASAQQRDAGWWVVVGSFPSDPPARQSGDLQRVGAAARRCGLRTFNDDSSKFVGFRSGLNVFVVGPFAARPDAERAQAGARRCFPGAYVKQARYLGE